MACLHLTCFNTLQIRLDEQPIERFRSVKSSALLVYLMLMQDRVHRRQTLAGLLWPDEPDPRARRNLNQILLHLRREIGDTERDQPFLLASKQTLIFDKEQKHWTDVAEFNDHLAAVQEHKHADLHTCATCTERLTLAAALYQGPFLDDFSIPDSDLFENWVVTTREELHQKALATFLELSDCYSKQGELKAAQSLLQRLLAMVPWQEELHQKLMRLFAVSGQRSQALAQYDTLSQMLMDEFGVSPSPQTDALYDQILAGALVEELPPTTAAPSIGSVLSPPFQVPAVISHFVGRSNEIEQVAQLLNQSDTTVVALVGMGGLGKTTLATQIAHQVRDNFPDGVLWANPAISSGMDILDNWGRAYGYDFSGLGDVESRAAAVRGVLAEKATLLVLDNVTHTAEVKPLFAGGERNLVLLTTRDLDVAHALNAQVIGLGELSAESGIALLINILGEERVGKEEEAAAQICEQLHFLPLAVEIAAQRLKSRARMKLVQMAERLANEQQRLGLEISDRAVRTSFEVSWESLDEELQAIFPLLAVFEGRPFTAEALAYIADMESFDVEDALFGLSALSLVKEDEEAYYRQHPLLADFAKEKFGALPYRQHEVLVDLAGEKLMDPGAAYGRLVDYYLGFADKNRQNYEALEPEWGNVNAAIRSAHKHELWAKVIGFTDLLEKTWMIRARYTDASNAYMWAQNAALHLNDSHLIATNLLRAGEIYIEKNDYVNAKRALSESLDLFYQLEETRGIADSLYQLACVASECSQYDDAMALLEKSQRLRTEIKDDSGIAIIMLDQARIFYNLGEEKKAEKLAIDAYQIQKRINDVRRMIPTLRLLAHIFAHSESYDNAVEYAQQAYLLSRDIDDEGEVAATYYTLTAIYRHRHEFEAALKYAQKALDAAQYLGLRRFEGLIYYQLSVILKELGSYDDALQPDLNSIGIFSDLGYEVGLAYSKMHLGDLYQCLAISELSISAWEEALEISTSIKHESLINSLHLRLN